MDIHTQKELNACCGSLKGMGNQHYRDCSLRNTKRFLFQDLQYKNGTQYIDQGGSCTQGWKWAPPNKFYCSTVRKEMHELFENDPPISLREVASEKGTAHTIVWNIFRRVLRLFKYKLHMSTALTDDHVLSRPRFYRYCRQQLRNDKNYLERIIFSEECKYSLSELVNKQNCRIWGTHRKFDVYETLHNSPSVMI